MKNLAVVCNTGLGDLILFERIAHALVCAGHSVCVYGNYWDKFSNWYPNTRFEKCPEDIEDPESVFWNKHEGYIFQEYAPGSHVKKDNIWVLGENYRQKHQSWLSHQEFFLKSVFGLENPQLISSMKPPEGLFYRKNMTQVVIHPTSLKEEKNWPSEKFIQLAQELVLGGYQPVFCVAENEKTFWQIKLKPLNLPLLVIPLKDLAAVIYESGYFIGNDSGIAHMAPALGIPSLKIFDRTSRALFWSGGWHNARSVTPWPIPTRYLRIKYWKACLSVSRVKRAFNQLVCENSITF